MMIGEIRDLETAQIAVQAALTGHLILSTLHTNDAASAVTRLLDMGVEDYLLTSTINGLVAQRLVRTLCSHCREPFEAISGLVDRMQLNRFTDKIRSCCIELLVAPMQWNWLFRTHHNSRSAFDVRFSAAACAAAREARLIQKTAVDEGMQTMYAHGMLKVISGVTTVEEVLRVTREF